VKHKAQDKGGRPLEVGDWVRIVTIPSDIATAPREVKAVFRAAFGKTFKVQAFDQYGHAELNLAKKVDALATIWVEPECLVRTRRGKRARKPTERCAVKTTMKKRIRKKKRVGEFQELGFMLAFRFQKDISVTERNALLDRFVEEAIEPNGLVFGGGGLDEWEGFVRSDKPRGSATEDHRKAVEKWLVQEPLVLSYNVGPLMDAWHDNFAEVLKEGWIDKSRDA
jgi:uncharacterized protein YggL (DUF469 family)